MGTLLGFRAVQTQREENQNLDDLSGYRSCAGRCDRSRKTIRDSQSHELGHDCTQRALELDRGRGAVDNSPLACRSSRISELLFHRTDAGAPDREIAGG